MTWGEGSDDVLCVPWTTVIAFVVLGAGWFIVLASMVNGASLIVLLFPVAVTALMARPALVVRLEGRTLRVRRLFGSQIVPLDEVLGIRRHRFGGSGASFGGPQFAIVHRRGTIYVADGPFRGAELIEIICARNPKVAVDDDVFGSPVADDWDD